MKKRKKKLQTRTVSKKTAFLKAYSACASLTAAAEAVGIDRSMHYEWMRKDAKYAAAFAQARIEAGQTLEDDAVHWARIGVYEPIIYQGQFQFAEREVILCVLPDGREVREEQFTPEQLAGLDVRSRRTIREKFGPPLGVFRRSEGLLARTLKAFKPQEYAERTEISGPDGAPIDTNITVTFVKPQ